MFLPGEPISSFISKKGNEVLLRFPSVRDVEEHTHYINKLSLEDTFITLSGEQFTIEEESKIVSEWLENMKNGDKCVIDAFVGDKLVGLLHIDRLTRRNKHVGHLGISVAKDYREEGIGKALLLESIKFAKQMNLRMLELEVYSLNENAIGLYKSVGFVEVGRIPGKTFFHGNYVDQIIMVKNLLDNSSQ